MALPLLASIGSMGLSALGQEQQRKQDIAGAESALRTTRRGVDFAEDVLGQALALQQPFIQAGQAALPLSELASRGELDFRDTPIFRQREESGLAGLVNSIQGDELSDFARDRFNTGLATSEEAMAPERLQDLLSIGLGASGTAGRQSGTLADLATQAAIGGGNIGATGAQTAFEQRQNTLNQTLGGLSGIPSFYAATRQSPTNLAGPQAGSSQGLFFGASR